MTTFHYSQQSTPEPADAPKAPAKKTNTFDLLWWLLLAILGMWLSPY